MNEQAFIAIVASLSTLAGTVVTAILQHVLAMSLERKRRQDESARELLRLRREAISAALQLFEPLRNAEIRASSMAFAAVRGDCNKDDVRERFPYPLGELTKLELPPHYRAILPEGLYDLGFPILRDLDELKDAAFRAASEFERLATFDNDVFEAIFAKTTSIQKQITNLEKKLGEAFQATFILP